MTRTKMFPNADTYRLTVQLPVDTHIALKVAAIRAGMEVSEFVTKALRAALSEHPQEHQVTRQAHQVAPHQVAHQVKPKAPRKPSQESPSVDAAELLAHLEKVGLDVPQADLVEAVEKVTGKTWGKDRAGKSAMLRAWRKTLSGGTLPREVEGLLTALENLGHTFKPKHK